MNYTRKRALLACDFCRHRKRRCDGTQPCSTCRESNADCVYKELPYDRIEDASPAAVVDRLARIESLLEQQSQQLHNLSTRSTPTAASVNLNYALSPGFPQATESADYTSHVPAEYLAESDTFLIPKGHTTLVTNLLSVPQVRKLLGDYPRGFFNNIEERQPLPDPLKPLQGDRRGWPPLRQNVLNKLSDSYFRNVHPHRPLFRPATFEYWQTKLLRKEPLDEAATAICLCVYALGAITTPQAAEPDAGDEVLGLSFFRPALGIILHEYTWNFKFEPDLLIVQALLLAGSYFLHLARPLHCWRMAFFASQRYLQYLEIRRVQDRFSEYSEVELRVFWQCFLDDCNRAEDLDVLRSGIEPLGDKMPLPHSLDPSDHDETIHFIAEITIRRLLNRVHSSLYSPDTELSRSPADPSLAWQGLSLQKLLALGSELDRQLEQWLVSIPDGIRPPLGVEAITSDRGRVLRIHYYAARHIIHRPFVMYAVSQQEKQRQPPQLSPGDSKSSIVQHQQQGLLLLPQVVLDKAAICINSCAAYLYNATAMLDRRTPYLWTFAQGCVACLVVLMLARGCAALRRTRPAGEEGEALDAAEGLRDVVVAKLRRWASPGNAFEAQVGILERLVFEEQE